MKTILFTLGIFLLALGCKERAIDDNYNPQLPPETQTGARTFGCKINGVVMIPQDGRNDSVPGGDPILHGLQFWIYSGARCVEASDHKYGRGGIIIKIPNSYNQTGTFDIMPIEAGYSCIDGNSLYVQATKNGKLYGSIENTGKITFTRNDNTVISGDFYCKLAEKNNPNNIIEITEGRFDLKK